MTTVATRTVGVNLSGAEYSWMPFASASDLDYLKSEGVNLLRLPISWERMQPTLNGPLYPTYLAGLEKLLSDAADRGMQVIVDLHNYGRYNLNYAAQAAANSEITSSNDPTAAVIGSSAVPVSAFANLWSQLAAQLDGHVGLAGYDIMNEPYNMGSTTIWPQAAQAAVNAIRTADTSTPIYVEGYQWAGAENWLANNANLHITDPANKIIYEAHQYFDSDGSGRYAQTYAQQGANPNTGVQDLQPFLDWLKANNYQGFVGELGVPGNDANWNAVLDNALSALQVAGVSSTVWNYVYADPSGKNSWWPVADPMSIDPNKGWGSSTMETIVSHTAAPGAPTFQPAVTQATAFPATGIEHAGDTITLTLAFNEAVMVSGTPTVSLNDGNTATYVSGSGTSSLTFRTTVASTDTNTPALAITGVNLPSGTSIKDASGVAANLSGAVKTFTGLQIDPILPGVTQATASPGTGIELVGDTITLTVGFNEAVTVSGTPALSLNDGATATYVGGSGTSALTFKTTVASTDTNTSALAITGVNLASGASIKDGSGVAANLAGAVKTFTGLQVATSSTAPPMTPTVQPAVTQATASPTTGIEHVGDTITLALGFNEAMTVAGTPTLSLNDGATAAYAGGSGTSALTFRTTVASTDTNTSALAITGVNLASGASIKDASGVAANLEGAVKTFTGLQVDPASLTTGAPTPGDPASSTAPVLTIADTLLSVTGGGGTIELGADVATTDPNDVVTVSIKGLRKYETITDNLDGHTFRGKNITLTAAQVDSGLTLQSNYRGTGDPVTTLMLVATAKDPVTSAVTTSALQTITVTDPPHATATTTESLVSQSLGLLIQSVAHHTGRVDPGQIVAAAPHGGNWNEQSFLTTPHH